MKNQKNIPELNLGGGMDFAPAPESNSHIEFKKKYELFIGGEFVAPAKGKYFPTINPATEEKIADIAKADASDVDKAVKSARFAYDNYWSKISGSERGKYLFRIARMLQERAREFAIIETMDGGKPIKESKGFDLPMAINWFFYYAGWADKLEFVSPGKTPESIGVAGQVIPWNFPLMMAAWKIAPALAAGNCVVLKPAETTSLTALKLAELIQEAGVPPGVVNIVTGEGDTGSAIVNHADVDKVAFTGSTRVGKMIQKSIAGSGKKLTLELGGKGANIIFEDAPLDQAVEGVINAVYFNQGHVCCAGSRLFVQEGIAETVIQKLKDRLKTLKIGNPLDKNTDIGAINSGKQLETVESYIKIGLNEGGKLYQDACEVPKKGFWCKPTIFTNVSQASRVVQEEIFGPVLTIQTFRSIDEVVELANNTQYGLSAGIWTDKGSKIFQVGNRLNAGVVWANSFNKFDAASPFGGFNESGFGREGGLHGLTAYLK